MQIFILLSPLGARADGAPKVGEQAPTIALQDIENSLFYLSRICGQSQSGDGTDRKVILLSFFATHCQACPGQINTLERIRKEDTANRIEVYVIGVREKTGALREHFRGKSLKVLADPYGVTAKRYRVVSLPHLFMLDDTCTIRAQVRGPLPQLEAFLRDNIQAILYDAQAQQPDQ